MIRARSSGWRIIKTRWIRYPQKRDVKRGFANRIDAERWRSSEQTLLDAVKRGDAEWTSWQEREAKKEAELARRNTQFEIYAYLFVEQFKQGKNPEPKTSTTLRCDTF